MTHTGPNLIFQYKKSEPRLLVTLMALVLTGNLGAAAGADTEPVWLDVDGRPCSILLTLAVFDDKDLPAWAPTPVPQLTAPEQAAAVAYLKELEQAHSATPTSPGAPLPSELVRQSITLSDAGACPHDSLRKRLKRKEIFANLWRSGCLQSRQCFMEHALATFLPEESGKKFTSLEGICAYLWCLSPWTLINSDFPPIKEHFYRDRATRFTVMAELGVRGEAISKNIYSICYNKAKELLEKTVDQMQWDKLNLVNAYTQASNHLSLGRRTGNYSELIGREYADIVTRLRGTPIRPPVHALTTDVLAAWIEGSQKPKNAERSNKKPQKSTKNPHHQPSHRHTAASPKSNDTSKKKKDAAPATNRSVAQTPAEALQAPPVGQAPSDAIASGPSSESRTAVALPCAYAIRSAGTGTWTPAASNLAWSDRTEEKCNFKDQLEVGEIYAPGE